MIKKGFMKKAAITSVACLLMFTMAIPVFATNDNYSYKFELKTGYANSYTGTKYRQTSNVENPWKVNMKKNTEGKGCIATYWLSNNDKERVSAVHNVKQGSGDHYYNAWKAANKTYVRLSAENNNNAACTVSGYWDEETN